MYSHVCAKWLFKTCRIPTWTLLSHQFGTLANAFVRLIFGEANDALPVERIEADRWSREIHKRSFDVQVIDVLQPTTVDIILTEVTDYLFATVSAHLTVTLPCPEAHVIDQPLGLHDVLHDPRSLAGFSGTHAGGNGI